MHRLDSTLGLTTWFVDGEKTLSMTFQVPTKPAQVVLNAWSDGDEGWTGEMTVGGGRVSMCSGLSCFGMLSRGVSVGALMSRR
jgi:hypothetical protein